MSCHCCCNNQNNSQNQVIYYNSSVYDSTTINSDVLLATLDTVDMPAGSQLPILTLPTNGSYIEIEFLGLAFSNANRLLKIQMGSTTQTVCSLSGQMVNIGFTTKFVITRKSQTSGVWYSLTAFNETQSQRLSGADYSLDFSQAIPIKFFINQSVATSIRIFDIRITKFIK